MCFLNNCTHWSITKGGGKRGEIQNSIILRKFGPENTHNQIQNTAQSARTHAAVAGRGGIQSNFTIKWEANPGGHKPRRQIWKEINQIPESNGRIGARIGTATRDPGKINQIPKSNGRIGARIGAFILQDSVSIKRRGWPPHLRPASGAPGYRHGSGPAHVPPAGINGLHD